MFTTLALIYFGSPQLEHKTIIKYNNCVKSQTVDSEIPNFDFLEKCLGLVSLPHFVYDFMRRIFLMLYLINRSNLIFRLLLLLEILDNMSIVIICLPVHDLVNFEINLSFLTGRFSPRPEKSGQKFKHLKNKKSFQGEIKSIFHHF